MIVLVLVVQLHPLIVNLAQMDIFYKDLPAFQIVEMVTSEILLVDLGFVLLVVVHVKLVLILQPNV